MNNKKGFTLAELLIVVAIIAVLVGIGIPIFTSQLEKSRESTDLANVRGAYADVLAHVMDEDDSYTMTVNLVQTKQDWEKYPVSIGDITVTSSNKQNENWIGYPGKNGTCTISYSKELDGVVLHWDGGNETNQESSVLPKAYMDAYKDFTPQQKMLADHYSIIAQIKQAVNQWREENPDKITDRNNGPAQIEVVLGDGSVVIAKDTSSDPNLQTRPSKDGNKYIYYSVNTANNTGIGHTNTTKQGDVTFVTYQNEMSACSWSESWSYSGEWNNLGDRSTQKAFQNQVNELLKK